MEEIENTAGCGENPDHVAYHSRLDCDQHEEDCHPGADAWEYRENVSGCDRNDGSNRSRQVSENDREILSDGSGVSQSRAEARSS